VVFALGVTVLLGMAALAIDVSRAYSEIRHDRSVADAASLAGAQQLQIPGTRNVTTTEQVAARSRALELLARSLGGSTSGCSPLANVKNCPVAGTPYVVSVTTPSPICVLCNKDRALQVQVRFQAFPLTFARVLGSSQWDVGATSVAGLIWGKSYGVVTLRPPKKIGSTFDVNDIVLSGTGTTVRVHGGEIGVNSNMKLAGTGAAVFLDPGYYLYHFDPIPGWVGPPAEQWIPDMIPDPNYAEPVRPTDPTKTYASAVAGEDTTTCADEIAKLPAAYGVTTSTPNVKCYNPGVYADTDFLNVPGGTPSTVALLKPGVYFLDGGANVAGTLIGGYEKGKPGVALVFKECQNTPPSSCALGAESAKLISLNIGDALPGTTGGSEATAALGWDGGLVQTSGPLSPVPALLMSIVVPPDPGCYVPVPPQLLIEPSTCDANQNKTLQMPGGGSLWVAGLQYAPTDNIVITGGSGTEGRIGQIISWTIEYKGGSTMNHYAAASEANGVLRLDEACSPGSPCVLP
jgi:hypothetical protein